MYPLKELFHRYHVAPEGSQEENYALEELLKWGVSKAGSYPSWMRIILEGEVIFELRFPQEADQALTVVIEPTGTDEGIYPIVVEARKNPTPREEDTRSLFAYAQQIGYNPHRIIVLVAGEVNVLDLTNQQNPTETVIFVLEI